MFILLLWDRTVCPYGFLNRYMTRQVILFISSKDGHKKIPSFNCGKSYKKLALFFYLFVWRKIANSEEEILSFWGEKFSKRTLKQTQGGFFAFLEWGCALKQKVKGERRIVLSINWSANHLYSILISCSTEGGQLWGQQRELRARCCYGSLNYLVQ